MPHFGGQCHCALFSEVRILSDAAFTLKPIDHQNGERGIVAACDVRARGQSMYVQMYHKTNLYKLHLKRWSENQKLHLQEE